MEGGPRNNADDLREAVKLLIQATTGVTDVVEAMHLHIASGPAILGKPLALPAQLITSLAYGNVRGITRFVGWTLDRLLRELGPLLGESSSGPERDALVAVLNGVLGDWLARTQSPLAIAMRLHRLGEKSERGEHPKIVVFVHGSSMNHRHWRGRAHDHGDALARDLGWTPVYVHYNSGLPLADNGRLLAALLEELAGADEIALVGHSMGGLVARLACQDAEAEGLAWRKKLRKLVTLGSPHRGAPLERGGSVLEELLPLTGYSAPLARLAKIRSAGVTDLGRGIDIPLPEGVDCYAIAASGDALVPVASAHGPFPEARCSVVDGAGHIDLLGSTTAYETIRRALSE
jgi:pimeloyl-ACP methyl ester carboxylesterase